MGTSFIMNSSLQWIPVTTCGMILILLAIERKSLRFELEFLVAAEISKINQVVPFVFPTYIIYVNIDQEF